MLRRADFSPGTGNSGWVVSVLCFACWEGKAGKTNTTPVTTGFSLTLVHGQGQKFVWYVLVEFNAYPLARSHKPQTAPLCMHKACFRQAYARSKCMGCKCPPKQPWPFPYHQLGPATHPLVPQKPSEFGKKCYVFIKDAHMTNVLCEQCCLSKDLHECSVHICLINNKCGEHILPRGLGALPDAVLSAAMVTADLRSF